MKQLHSKKMHHVSPRLLKAAQPLITSKSLQKSPSQNKLAANNLCRNPDSTAQNFSSISCSSLPSLLFHAQKKIHGSDLIAFICKIPQNTKESKDRTVFLLGNLSLSSPLLY